MESNQVSLITQMLDGRMIGFSSQTIFLVQTSKNRGAYNDRYKFIGNLSLAVMYYNLINLRHPYNKRLVMVGANRPILAREKGV